MTVLVIGTRVTKCWLSYVLYLKKAHGGVEKMFNHKIRIPRHLARSGLQGKTRIFQTHLIL